MWPVQRPLTFKSWIWNSEQTPCYNTANRLDTFFRLMTSFVSKMMFFLCFQTLLGINSAPVTPASLSRTWDLFKLEDFFFQEVLRAVVGALSRWCFVQCGGGIAALFCLCRNARWESCFGSGVALRSSAACGICGKIFIAEDLMASALVSSLPT